MWAVLQVLLPGRRSSVQSSCSSHPQMERTEASLATLTEAQPCADGGAPAAETACSFCGQAMDGNILRMDQPPMVCHQECCRCAVCGVVLGNLLAPMFLRGQEIHCKTCYLGIFYR